MTRDLTGQVVKAEAHCFAVGGFADIWKGNVTNKDPNEEVIVAVKVLRGPIDHTMRRLLRETTVWTALKHPNITPFLGVSFDFDRPHTPCLISPFYRHGDIVGYLKEYRNIEILPLIAQIAGALSYLHDRSIIHGDIKGSNVLIQDSGEVCLADFSCSRILDAAGLSTIKSRSSWHLKPNEELPASNTEYATPIPRIAVATDLWSVSLPLIDNLTPSCVDEGFDLTTEGWRWMAPELMSMEEETIPLVTTATDVYSFAIAVCEIFTQRIPFWHIKVDASVILHVVSGGRPKRRHYRQVNDDIWCMLEKCWSTEPDRRPSMAALFDFFGRQLTSLTAERARL